MEHLTENDAQRIMGTIQHAIFVETSTNPHCPIATELINQALSLGDAQTAYEIALDSLKPRRSVIQKISQAIKGLTGSVNKNA